MINSTQDISETIDNEVENTTPTRLPRRRLLGNAARLAAAGAIAGWLPVFRVTPADAQVTCATPPNFPAGISLYQQAYENWSRQIHVDSVWTCAPNTPADVVAIVNWAKANGYKVRPRGAMHGWSPLTLPAGTPACPTKVVLVDTTQHLTAVAVNTATQRVTAQAGITMLSLLTALETAGLGITSVPAPGNVTLGGVLAIGGHGAAACASAETALPSQAYGTVSNLVVALTAVVWDAGSNQYVLRTFQRSDPGCAALLTHLGRTFITEATLQAATNQRLRCQSWFNVTAAELFATQGSGGNTFASYVASTGRVEAILFPFTDKPWLKVWSVSPTKPLLSRQVNSPYNYPFSDGIPQSIVDLISQIQSGNPAATPTLGQTQYNIVAAGLVTTFSYDIWGWAKNLQFYIKPTTLRVEENGYAVITSRANIQRVVNEFYTFFQARIAAYQAQGLYPMNGPLEIRTTGLDRASDIAISGANSPQLSAIRARPDHPEWDTAVWFDILTIPGTGASEQFYRELEQWMLANYVGSYATLRPEWSKAWAYTNTAGWSDTTMLTTTIPNLHRAGQPAGDSWDAARSTLDQLDPSRIFSAPLLDILLP